jgi:hypothetical protein
LRRENEQLKEKLAQAQVIIEVQGYAGDLVK